MLKKAKERNKKRLIKFTETEVGVLLEDLGNKMDFIIEGQKISDEKNEKRFTRLESRFDNLESRFDNLESRFDNLEGRFDNLEGRYNTSEKRNNDFRTETANNFRLVLDHLSRIEDEIMEINVRIKEIDENKIDKKEFYALASKVEKIARELDKYKAMVLAKAR